MLSCKEYVIKKKEKMNRLQKYLLDALGIEVKEKSFPNKNLGALPLYLRSIYKFKRVSLFERQLILLVQNIDEYLTADQYRKHIKQIEQTYNLPVILVLETIESYKRKRLIEKKVAFIIPGKQMFIPQLLIDLKEFTAASKKKRETIQPAAQCLLLFHLLKENIEEMNFRTIAEKTKYTPMSISRAANDLAEREICRIEGRKDKQIIFDADRRTIWERALPFLQNPLKRKIYLEDHCETNLLYQAGYSALAFYTNLAGESFECYAISKTDYMYLEKHQRISATNKIEGQFCIEIWKYAPGILAEKKIVDPLSLYLSLKDEKDERVEFELTKMIERLW